jgi:hypothetical protein
MPLSINRVNRYFRLWYVFVFTSLPIYTLYSLPVTARMALADEEKSLFREFTCVGDRVTARKANGCDLEYRRDGPQLELPGGSLFGSPVALIIELGSEGKPVCYTWIMYS